MATLEVEEVIPSLLIEVCVDSVDSAVNAVKGGADRLEVCANLGVGGGTTPSVGLVRSIQKALKDVPLMIMVRPRVGDFVYNHHEIDVMLEDIESFKELGIRGFVIGALTKGGTVDIEGMKRLIDAILPLEVCFHRAFDMTRDPGEALQDIIDIGGISRLLTSGHGPSVSSSLPTLERIFERAKDLQGSGIWGITVMPGGGVNRNTIAPVVQRLLPKGLREIHLSGGKWAPSEAQFRRSGMGFGASPEHDWEVWQTNKKEVQRVREAADIAWDQYWDGFSDPEAGEEESVVPSVQA